MKYSSPLIPTGGNSEDGMVHQGWKPIRMLTTLQDSRSAYYEVVNERTGRVISRPKVERPEKVSGEKAKGAKITVAEREHIGRLLRECREKCGKLLDSNDPIDATLLGVGLTSILKELWENRNVREDDWIDILNLLQIVLSREEFETMDREKREALVKIFEEGLITRPVGRFEIERTMQLLSHGGFDIWCGLSESTEKNG